MITPRATTQSRPGCNWGSVASRWSRTACSSGPPGSLGTSETLPLALQVRQECLRRSASTPHYPHLRGWSSILRRSRRACHRRLVADRGCAHIVNPDDSCPPLRVRKPAKLRQNRRRSPWAVMVGPPVQPKPALWSAGLSTMPPVTGHLRWTSALSNLDDVGFWGRGEGGSMYRITACWWRGADRL